jgi:hypothetical protein
MRFGPGRALPCQSNGRSFELELAFTGLFTRDPHVCMRACARSLSPDLHRHHDRAPAMGTAGTASRVMTCGGSREGG